MGCLAAALFALSLFGSLLDGDGFRGPLRVSAIVIAAVSCAAVTVHHRRPRTVTAVTMVCGALFILLGFRPNPFLLSPAMLSLLWLSVRTDRRTAWASSLSSATLLTGAAFAFGPGSWLEPGKAAVLAWALLPGAVGDAVRSRRGFLAAVEERAERAEQSREEEARRRVAEERVRIARDLHDVVAHHIALANAQAGVAVHLMARDPEKARTVLEQITETTSSALQELKATVGLLRQPDDPAAPLEPSPGIAQIPALVDSFQHAGLEVTVWREGEEHPLSPGVDLTAYRIVQEALTNVAKHAHTGSSSLTLKYTRTRLVITVEDSGSPHGRQPDSPSGYGMIGMRERAAAVGGRLRAGPQPEGGFRVSTELPLHTRAGDPTSQGETPT